MADPTTTIRAWPPGAESAGARAAAIIEAKVGAHEEGANTGLIVRWSIAGFEGLGAREGQKWCAWCACQALYQALQGEALLQEQWLRIVSGNCDTLWARMQGRGWAWAKADPPGVPEVGDFAFFGSSADLYHVGIVTAADVQLVDGHAAGRVCIVSGNNHDAVRSEWYTFDHETLYGFARVPF